MAVFSKRQCQLLSVLHYPKYITDEHAEPKIKLSQYLPSSFWLIFQPALNECTVSMAFSTDTSNKSFPANDLNYLQIKPIIT